MTDPHRRNAKITPEEAREAVCALADYATQTAAARSLGIGRCAFLRRIRQAHVWGITAHGAASGTPAIPLPATPGKLRRYILTAAQNNTAAHPEFWSNLQALAKHYRAEIMVARIRYNHSAGQVGQEKTARSADHSLWYDAKLEPYFRDTRVQIAPGLIWAGDMNIIPTATDPLSGLDSFTGIDSCIFPHPQIALKSIATAPGVPGKMNYTTGAVTLKNYIRRKAGFKAEFHHAFGALLVEVDRAGDWFARQINAGRDGVLQDLDVQVSGGIATTGHSIEVFTPGDLHGTKADPVALALAWGKGGIVEALRPRAQILHDVLNFGARSHHNTAFDLIAAHYERTESVEDEVKKTADLLARLSGSCPETYVVKANHDEHLDRWVRDADFRRDPVNAAFYLTAAGAVVEAMRTGNTGFDLVAWALRRAGVPVGVRFLSRSDRLVIAGVRHDLHGDIGPNGARGSAANIARTGERATVGHSHSATIAQGCYQVGTFSVLDMGYNRGPSSWSHSCALTYASGKRAILTIRNGKWRA